jgi:polar amino acid transport system substrate-binding protein
MASLRSKYVYLFLIILLFANSVFVSMASAKDYVSPLKSKTLRVGVDATFAPFEFVKDGKKKGFDIDLMSAISKELGIKKLEWVDLDFKGLIPGLLAGHFDIVASAMYITDKRKKVVDFSESYYPGGLVVLVKADNNAIKTPKDLNGKKVVVQIGTKSSTFIREKYPQVKVVDVEKNADMFNMVELGRADAAVTGRPAAQFYVKKNHGLKIMDKQLTIEEYAFAVRKDSAELLQTINRALLSLKKNGTHKRLVEKWFEGKDR